MHVILEEFLRGARPRTGPDEPWDDDDRARMRAITAARCADAERRGITGRAVAWQLARRRIDETVEHFLAVDTSVRATFGVVPDVSGLELAFGTEGRPPVTVPLAGGRTVRFRGRIDRVDVSPGGERVVVYDYKTGKSDDYEAIRDGDPVAGGRKLQLPVYALAAEQHHHVTDARAYYWFTRPTIDSPLIGYAADDCRDRFSEALTTIADGVAAGCFPAVPGNRTWSPWDGDTFDNCRHCDFDRLCPVERESAWQRKHDDDVIEPFHRLTAPDEAGVESVVEDEEAGA